MRKIENPKVICGLHRSGTTYLGSILSKSQGMVVVHELFNIGNGLKGNDVWYPYLTINNQHNQAKLVDLIKGAMLLKGGLKRLPKQLTVFHLCIYKIFSGRLQWPWQMLRVRGALGIAPKHIVWKDPFCTFMLDFLTKELALKSVCVVRHPCALFHSIQKQDWFFDIAHLHQQTSLIQDYGADISPEIWEKAKVENVYAIAILWKLMSRVISKLLTETDKLLVIRHEDLCVNPEEEVTKVFNHLDIELSEDVLSYLDVSTNAKTVETSKKETLSLSRNSKEIVNVWVGKITDKDEQVLREVIGEDWKVFYE